MQDLNDQILGGNLTADEFNEPMSEIQSFIESMGQVLSGADLLQLSKAIAQMSAGGNFYTGSGPVNAYIATKIGTQQGIFEYSDGLLIRFRPSITNTGISTVAVNSLAAKTIKRANGNDLEAGDLDSSKDAHVRYDGTDFLLGNEQADVDVPTLYIEGLRITRGSSTTLMFETGVCRAADDTATIRLGASILKSLSNWIEGTGNGGFPSGLSLSANTWYRCFVIMKPDGTIDAGFDTSATATNLLSDATGYTKYRRVGWIRTNGASQLKDFAQDLNNEALFLWGVVESDVSVVVGSTANQTAEITAPPNSEAEVTCHMASSNQDVYILMYSKLAGTQPAGNIAYSVKATGGGNDFTTSSQFVALDASSELYWDSSSTGGNPSFKIQCFGWRDYRKLA